MKRMLLSLVAVLVPVCAAQAQGTITLQVLGPAVYVRQAGPPVTTVLPFTSEFGGPALLNVVNGSLEDSSVETVSSSVIKLNGKVVFAPAAFNQHVRQLAADVQLARGPNTLEVELRGKPGGQISCQVVQPVGNLRVVPFLQSRA
jgi:hypothetical protein